MLYELILSFSLNFVICLFIIFQEKYPKELHGTFQTDFVREKSLLGYTTAAGLWQIDCCFLLLQQFANFLSQACISTALPPWHPDPRFCFAVNYKEKTELIWFCFDRTPAPFSSSLYFFYMLKGIHQDNFLLLGLKCFEFEMLFHLERIDASNL